MISDHFILPDENGFRGMLLDALLASGYYRMQHLIFTTHHTKLDITTDAVPVFWLRTCINDIHENKAAYSIRKKCAPFDVRYKQATITDELEELYSIYRNHVNFSTAITCRDYLHQIELDNPYDSWMIEIRDDNKLVAAGFFDKGINSISGIINFYHPVYSKYSLGKFLVLKKIDYALAHGIPYYYTGYISTANTKFDYKLFPDKKAVEVFLPVEKVWESYTHTGKEMLEVYFLNNIVQQPGAID